MIDQELSLDDLDGGFLGIEYLILDVDYAMVLNVEYDGQPDDTPVSLILGPEQEERRLIDACLAEHREELSIRRLECRRCNRLELNRHKEFCDECHSRLEVIRDSGEEWLRGQAWRRLQWEMPGFQSRSVVPKGLVQELYPGNAVTLPDLVLPRSMVFQRLLEEIRQTRKQYVKKCWGHLYVGNSARDLLPRGDTLEQKHRHYLITREKLIAGYNWLTGIGRQYPEFMEDYEQHKGIRRFPPVVMLEAPEPRPTQVKAEQARTAAKVAADDKVPGSNRKRSTKEQTELKVLAAITCKIEHPEASEAAVAERIGIPRTTLNPKAEWQDWSLKVEQTASPGELSKIKAAFDKRIGEFVASKNTNEDEDEEG